MMRRRSWRKRSFGAILGLTLGWVAAAYAPGALHQTMEVHPSADVESHRESAGEADPPATMPEASHASHPADDAAEADR